MDPECPKQQEKRRYVDLVVHHRHFEEVVDLVIKCLAEVRICFRKVKECGCEILSEMIWQPRY